MGKMQVIGCLHGNYPPRHAGVPTWRAGGLLYKGLGVALTAYAPEGMY